MKSTILAIADEKPVLGTIHSGFQVKIAKIQLQRANIERLLDDVAAEGIFTVGLWIKRTFQVKQKARDDDVVTRKLGEVGDWIAKRWNILITNWPVGRFRWTFTTIVFFFLVGGIGLSFERSKGVSVR